MSLGSSLIIVSDRLRSRLGVRVALGRPDNAVAGIYIWPWRIVPDPAAKNSPPEPPSNSAPADLQIFNIHFLLFAVPSGTVEALSMLDSAQKAVFETPVFDVSGSRFRAVLDPGLNTANLAALFIAARLELTLCLPFVLQSLSPSP